MPNTNTNLGLVHLYVGDGKGKTTAAMGLAMRALGAGRKVLIVQFLKGRHTSELSVLNRLGIKVVRTEGIVKFTNQMNQAEKLEAAASCKSCLDCAREALASSEYGLVVLDEVVDAVNSELLDITMLLETISSRVSDTEVVMTGRNPKDPIIEVADYLTVMTALKHPYQRGVASRMGIEY